jgi:hypothetical protein
MFDGLSKKRKQNRVVFASNWRSGNLAFVFIEEVGEWNSPVFAFLRDQMTLRPAAFTVHR